MANHSTLDLICGKTAVRKDAKLQTELTLAVYANACHMSLSVSLISQPSLVRRVVVVL